MSTTYINVARYVNSEDVPGATDRATVVYQLRSALQQAAINISAESPTTDRRQNLVTAVIGAPDRYAEIFLPLVLLNNSGALWAFIADGQTLADPDILGSVAGLWNTVAGRDAS